MTALLHPCRWCGKTWAACPSWSLHEEYDRASETTWRQRARTAMAVLTPDDEEMDRAAATR